MARSPTVGDEEAEMRRSWLPPMTLLALALALVAPPTPARADEDIKIAGTLAAGGPVALPVTGAPVVLTIAIGVLGITLDVTVTSQTVPDAEEGLPRVLNNGDRVEVEAVVGPGGTLQATEIEVEDFPELEFRGRAQGVPPAGIPLPLAAGTADFTLVLLGFPLPMRLTTATIVDDVPAAFTLTNGGCVQAEGFVSGGVIQVSEIKAEDGCVP
jgi:hypothetical protein